MNPNTILSQREVGGERVVSVCMDCMPGRALFALWPWLEGNITLSHGICRAHAKMRRREIEEWSQKQTASNL